MRNKIALSLVIAGLAFSGACSSKKVSKAGVSIANNGTEDAKPETSNDTMADETGAVEGTDKVAALSAGVGLLNFRQVAATYQALTGITLANTAVAAEYAKQAVSLPNDAAPAAISASKVAAATKLAAAYCDVLSTTPASLSARFPGLSLAAVPADSVAFSKTLVDGFFGAESMLQGPRATDIASVAATVDALKGMTGATGPTIFMATCAGLLASAEFFLY